MEWDVTSIPADLVLWLTLGMTITAALDIEVTRAWMRKAEVQVRRLWVQAIKNAAGAGILVIFAYAISHDVDGKPEGKLLFIFGGVIIVSMFFLISYGPFEYIRDEKNGPLDPRGGFQLFPFSEMYIISIIMTRNIIKKNNIIIPENEYRNVSDKYVIYFLLTLMFFVILSTNIKH